MKKLLFSVLVLTASTVQAQDTEIQFGAGALVLTSTTNEVNVEPHLFINVRTDLADSDYSPILKISAELGALPGKEPDVADPGSIRSLETVLRIAQPISEKLYFRPYVEIGFSTKLPGETTFRDRTARFWAAGLEVGDSVNAISVGIGTDQRLDGRWAPSVTVLGKVRMIDRDIDLSLVGKAILTMEFYKSERRDAVLVGMVITR